MSLVIRKFNPLLTQDKNKKYRPAFVVIGKKIYTADTWNDLFKMTLFSFCYKKGNMEKILEDVNIRQVKYNDHVLITDRVEESASYTKFSPDLYVRVFNTDQNNYAMLNKIKRYINQSDFPVYISRYDSDSDLDGYEDELQKTIENLKESNKYKNGSSRYLIAHINGKVLSRKEKFYRRIEKEFDSKTLIGDIDILEDEDLLKEYMLSAINRIAFDNIPQIEHEKVFAYGMVRMALKHYASKTFWPFVKEEYGVSVPGNYQNRINDKYRKIMNKYGKLYDEETTNFIQNICMHAFVCNKCAEQFFDYMFEFWRIDLSRNIENSVDDDGNDLFDILIEEIGESVQDIMIHTTMALKMNPIGSKIRFRNILRMIDNSYWNDADYSDSSNRMTMLFNEWKKNPNGLFAKEIKRSATSRHGGKGEKLLSRPTITFDPKTSSFSLVLPKQILKNCTEEEHPIWYVSVAGETVSFEPTLLRGKAFLFTEECSLLFKKNQLFEETEIVLKSERMNYYRRTIKAESVRFFNSRNRNTDISNDYISKDIAYLFVQKGKEVTYINGSFSMINSDPDEFDMCFVEPSEGDILMLPDGHALSIGRPLVEGIIGNSRVGGTRAIFDEQAYQITADRERLFFKTTKNRFHGTMLRIYQNGNLKQSVKISENKYLEFKLDDSINEIYGYIIDLHDYISGNGIFRIDIDIPGSSVRSYPVCYIKGFNYQFVAAPYVFKESGRILFPPHLEPVTNEEWEINSQFKALEFSIDESSKDGNDWVSERKLIVPFKIAEEEVNIEFDLPVLYWKYKASDEWLIQQPEDTTIKALPDNIYIAGDLDLSSVNLYFANAEDLGDTQIGINHDIKNDLYYFRAVDIVSHLNRDRTYRELHISINDMDRKFFSIACKSVVRSQNISGDFVNGKIYGYFDIFGNSDYMVTVKRGDDIIEEDVPVVDGRFEIECEVKEGTYEVYLYEIEDDDSGFGSVSYELDHYDLNIVDVRNFGGKTIEIQYIRDRKKRFASLPLRADYYVKDLKKITYGDEIEEGDIYTWLYDSSDNKEMSSFVYYSGDFGCFNKSGYFVTITKAIVIFDNIQNANEVLINLEVDGYCDGLQYSPDRQILQPDIKKLSKNEYRRIRMIDDDIYTIGIKFRR